MTVAIKSAACRNLRATLQVHQVFARVIGYTMTDTIVWHWQQGQVCSDPGSNDHPALLSLDSLKYPTAVCWPLKIPPMDSMLKGIDVSEPLVDTFCCKTPGLNMSYCL
jgi:hypothetical protein